MNDIKNYEEENDEILNFILENRFFKIWRNNTYDNLNNIEEKDQKELKLMSTLELFITADCNLKCKYCYLNQYGEKLYPITARNKENIINNLILLFEWFKKEKFCFNTVDLFSGEIWHTDFGFKILGIILSYIDQGVYIKNLIIPTNCSFALEEDTLYKMQSYIDLYASKNSNLSISCSIEGKYLEEETRSFKKETDNEKRNERFYDTLFTFCKKNNFLFHPMVAASNVDKWIKNLDWYTNKLKEIDYFSRTAIMMLEVRNGDWDEKSIKSLLKYYDYEIEQHLKADNYNIKTFAYDLLGKTIPEDDAGGSGYCNYTLVPGYNTLGCSIPSTLTIRVGDLSIVPCHRTAYEKFCYGKIIVNKEKNKIEKIIANNPQMAIRVLATNNVLSAHKCDVCIYNKFCLKGCYGSQFETTGDPFMPIPEVCKMMEEKFNFLIDKYESLGVIKEWEKIESYDPYYEIAQEILNSIKKIQDKRKMEGKIL